MQNNPPPNYTPPNYPPPAGQPFGQPPKKSKAPWIIAGALGCLIIVVVIVALFGGLAYLGFKKADEAAKSFNTNDGGSSGTNRATPPPRAANMVHYVNTKEGRTGNLEKYYVPFSFDYPSTWKLD